MRLFKRSKKKETKPSEQTSPPPGQVAWATNAPAHWPALITDPLPAPDPQTIQDWAKNHLMFILAITKTLGDAVPGLKIASVDRNYVFPWGILNVPVEIEENEKRYPVFLYPQANEMYASRYYAAADILPRKGVEKPVYYAPAALPQASPTNPLKPFSLDMLSQARTPEPGRYAMWWRTETDTEFVNSKTIRMIHELYNTLDKYNSYFFGMLCQALGLITSDAPRVTLPDREASIPIKGPEFQSMFISASREKGIRFHFHTTAATVEYRDSFLALFLTFAKELRGKFEQMGLPEDPPDEQHEGGPLGWWRFSVQVAQRHEKPSGVEFFGVIEQQEQGK